MSIAKMSYEEFKAVVAEKFMDYMPEEYKHMDISIHEVKKVNCVKDAVCIYNSAGSGVSPVVYLDDMYINYLRSDLQGALSFAAKVIVDGIKTFEMPAIDFATIRKNVIVNLINSVFRRSTV